MSGWGKAVAVEGDVIPNPSQPNNGAGPQPTAQPATQPPGGGWGKATPVTSTAVDYDSGLTFGGMTVLAGAENKKEAVLGLSKVYGASNVKDIDDTLSVKIDGKWVAADGGHWYKKLAANILGTGVEQSMMVGGGLIGGALGAPAGPAGIIGGAAVGAGAGAAAGHAVQEKFKQWMGVYDQSPDEAKKNMVDAAIAGTAGEFGGRLVVGAISKIARGGLPKMLNEATPEMRAQNERILQEGGRLPMQTAAPGLKHFAYMESLAQKVSGENGQLARANEAVIANRMKGILQKGDIPASGVDDVLREIGNPDSIISTEEAGTQLKAAATAHQDQIVKQGEASLAVVSSQVDSQIGRIEKAIGNKDLEGLGLDVAKTIQQSRRDFGTAMSKAYNRVDQLVGSQPLVPTALIQREAKRIGRLMLRTDQTAAAGELGRLPQPAKPVAEDVALFQSLGIELPISPEGRISFADAQRTRSLLRERADSGELTKGVRQGELQHLANTVDQAIQMAAQNPVARPAVQLLNQTDRAYARGIGQFQDTTVRKLVKDAETGIAPDPEKVAQTILRPGNEARVVQMRKLVGEENWKRVAAADYSNMLSAAREPATGAISGVSLLNEVTKRGKLMEHVYGPRISGELRDVAMAVASRDGQLPADALKPGMLRDSITKLHADQAAAETWGKENALKSLASPTGTPEEAYRYLTQPGKGSVLRKAINQFGEGSTQIQALRQTALKQLLTATKMSTASETPVGALIRSISRYSPGEQKMLFPHGLDSDIKMLAKDVDIMMKEGSDASKASFAAGAINLLPFGTRIPVTAALGIYQNILSRPTVTRYFTTGLRSPSGAVRSSTKRMLKYLVQYGTLQGFSDDHNSEGGQETPAPAEPDA